MIWHWRKRKRVPPQREPLIGIWWDDGKTLVALAHPLSENSSGKRLADSLLTHEAEWANVAAQFGKSGDDEYFEMPRGRVIVDRRTRHGIIYQGNDLPPDRIQRIAEFYQLRKWEARYDDHYVVMCWLDLAEAEE